MDTFLVHLKNEQVRGAKERAREAYVLYDDYASDVGNKVTAHFCV